MGTHSAFGEGSHTTAYTAKQVAFWVGALSLPSDRFARSGNPAWPGVRTANFAAFGPWSGVLQKDTESLRDSDALMRVAVPRRRGPAGLRCLVCNLAVLLFFRSAFGTFCMCEARGYHHSRRALHVVETPDARLSKRLTRRFLDLTDSSLIPAAQNIVPFLYRYQKDQRDTRWSFHFCSHLLTCPDRPDRGT